MYVGSSGKGGAAGSSPMDMVLDLLDSTDSTIVISMASKKGGKVLVAIGEEELGNFHVYVCMYVCMYVCREDVKKFVCMYLFIWLSGVYELVVGSWTLIEHI